MMQNNTEKTCGSGNNTISLYYKIKENKMENFNITDARNITTSKSLLVTPLMHIIANIKIAAARGDYQLRINEQLNYETHLYFINNGFHVEETFAKEQVSRGSYNFQDTHKIITLIYW